MLSATLLVTTLQHATTMGEPINTTPHPNGLAVPAPPMGMLFIQPRGGLPTIRRWRSCSDLWAAFPPKAEKQKASSKIPEGKSMRSLCKRLRSSADDKMSLVQGTLPQIQPPGLPQPVSHMLENGRFCWPPWLGCPWSPGHVTGQKELHSTNHMAKNSSKDICYFWVILPTESPKIMGLKGIHSPKTLEFWAGLLLNFKLKLYYTWYSAIRTLWVINSALQL